MTSRRSYLDTLNTGRQRRTNPSLDELNRTLQALETQLERPSPFADLRPEGGPETRREAPQLRPQRRSGLEDVARDLERSRREGDGIAAVSQIAGELNALREEMRQQMALGLSREFETLRDDLRHLASESARGMPGAEVLREVERISAALADLSSRSDDRAIGVLRLELEQMKTSLGSLAREDTLREVGHRWDDFDRRMTLFEENAAFRAAGHGEDAAIAALNDRLEQIAAAVDQLPESLSLRTLEERVRTLAGAVDHFARRQDTQSVETFEMIGERLDEISRAIAASASFTTSAVDPLPFQRIEARMASLASQIQELTDERPSHEILGQMAALSARVDEIAARSALPEKAVERLGRQLTIIVERLEAQPATPDTRAIFDALERRFALLSETLERRQSDSVEQGNILLRDLEARLDLIVDRLDAHGGHGNAELLDTIDHRFAALADQLDKRVANGPEAASIRALEGRLEDIATRLDISARQVETLDRAVVARLEEQVADLAAHLAQPARAMPELDDLAPRLRQIEQMIAHNHDALLEAARDAAANAVRDLAGRADPEAVAGLSGELRSLEILTRKSDDRNTRTFEAIHDTLIKIVDRLSAMEQSEPARALVAEAANSPVAEQAPASAAGVAPQAKPLLQDAPSIMAEDAEPLEEPREDIAVEEANLAPAMPAVPRSPAEMAAAAASAAMDGPQEAASRRKASMLSRVLRRKEKPAPAPAAEPEPEPVLAEPEFATLDRPLEAPLDPAIANQPLEPGSGGPDLNAIMKRVRDERGGAARIGETDTAKSDFIAAARRAAQAAAAEADMKKRSGEGSGGPHRGPIGRLLGGRAKTFLLSSAAVLVLGLAGLQLGHAFLGTDQANPQVAERDGEGHTASLVAEAKPQDLPPMIEEKTAGSPVEAGTGATETSAAPITAPVAAAGEAVPAQEDPIAERMAALPEQPAAVAGIGEVPHDAGPAALREAAEAGDAKAILEIGARYAEGRNGGTADMEQAAMWYERAAELGYAPAQYRIGNLYEKGVGVERDIAKAKALYEKSAAQGNASAMHNLAVLLAMGTEGAADNNGAARWFKAAAEHGVKDSQFNLGILAARGVGMAQNLEDSYKWFALVAKEGDKDAAGKRDEVARSLKPEQLARAQAAVELWRARDVDHESNVVEIPDEWKEGEDVTAGIDMTQAVKNIQLILNKNGYETGAPDGVMGERTKAAIKAFQADNGLTADGAVNEPLVRALLARK